MRRSTLTGRLGEQLDFIGYFVKQFNSEYERVILSILEENPRAKFVDLGCYDGRFTSKMADKIRARKVFGIDLVKEELDKACEKGITCKIGDLNEPLPFRDGSFDVVCAIQIIEHLSETDRFLKEVHRVLKPGGYLVISTPNLASFHNIFFLLLGRQPLTATVSDEMKGDWKGLGTGVGPAHKRLFTISGLTKLLTYHKFKVEKVIGSSFYPLPIPLARIICLLDRRHKACINIKARKEI